MQASDITADRVEGLLKELIDGIPELDAFESTTGLDVRNLLTFMRMLCHDDDEYHNGEDILTHTKWVVSDARDAIGMNPDGIPETTKLVTLLAALLHDVGKAYTYEVQPDGKHTFRKHAARSVLIAEAMLKPRKAELGSDVCARTIDLIRHHDAFMRLLEGRKEAKDHKYLNWFLRTDTYTEGHTDDLMGLALADGWRSKCRDRTLADVLKVLSDIELHKAQLEKAAADKTERMRKFTLMLPDIQIFLRPEVPEAAKLTDLAAIRTVLGNHKRYDLIKRIEAMISR